MKIGMDLNTKAIKEYTKPLTDTTISRSEKNSAARLDLSSFYAETAAYTEHGKTMEDIGAEAGLVDVELQRNYMTVVSNTMSAEDYKKVVEEGVNISELGGEDSVTILDHIKAVMAESGQVVAGYNDDLDAQVMKEITGKTLDSATIKETLEAVDLPSTNDNVKKILESIGMLDNIDSLSDGSIKYMVENDLAPTIGNIYTGRYSAADDGSRQARGYYAEDMGGYFAKKADSINWDEMDGQLKKALDQMQLENMPADEQLSNARWLLEKGVPVTEDKINQLSTIKQVEFPVPVERIVTASIQAIAAGLEPKDGNLAKDSQPYNKAYEQEKSLISSNITRQEARLKLTLDANVRLLKEGISLDTDSIENIIEALKKDEEDLRRNFFGQGSVEELSKKTEIFVNTTNIMRELPALPAATLGVVTGRGQEFTIQNVHSTGSQLSVRFTQATNSYEALGTEVRRDLGDSITKAFRNVNDILKDLNLETSESNQRAVRILGYNSMVINETEIKKIVDADSKIQNLIKGLTPGKTLQLIREGLNPLDMDIDEVVRHIEEMDYDPKRDAEKYSKFLYKLEKSGEITEEEKTSYIGIYRMLNRLERTDHAAVGRILESGSQITFANLLTAMRSQGKTFDLKIDDGFGFLSETIKGGTSISDQIEAAFVNHISLDKNEELENMYAEEAAARIRETAKAPEGIIEDLLDNNSKVSADNIEALLQFNEEPNSFYRYMRAYSRRVDNRTASRQNLAARLEKAGEDLIDNFDGKKEAGEGFTNLTDVMTDVLTNMSDYGADTSVDFRSLGLMYKQMSLTVSYAREENYHVPAMVGGSLTDINVRLVHGQETGLVSAKMDTDKWGSVSCEIRLSSNKVDAIFTGENREYTDGLKEIGDSFQAEVLKGGYESVEIKYIVGSSRVSGKLLEKNADNNNETVDNRELYGLAKKFIQAVKIS